jgi:hypothetical protein
MIRRRADVASSGTASPRHLSMLRFVRCISTLSTYRILRPRDIVDPRLATSATATVAAAAKVTAAEAEPSSRGESPDLPAVVVAAECI